MVRSLSNRLMACCGYVRPGDRVADVGCDHGLLGIYLLRTGIAQSVIASDIREGPLHQAVINGEKYGVSGKMSFFLCDGVQGIPRDFDCMVCAGMGGDTMVSILEAAPWLRDHRYRLILQCQSKRPMLREYLNRRGFAITRETLAKDGKFLYPVMEVIYQPGPLLTPGAYYLSHALLESGSPLLTEYRQRVLDGLRRSIAGLKPAGGEKYEQFCRILEEMEGENRNDNRWSD